MVTGKNYSHYIQNKLNKTDHREETFYHLAIQDCPCFRTDRLRIMRNKHWVGTHLWKLDKIYELSKEHQQGLKKGEQR